MKEKSNQQVNFHLVMALNTNMIGVLLKIEEVILHLPKVIRKTLVFLEMLGTNLLKDQFYHFMEDLMTTIRLAEMKLTK